MYKSVFKFVLLGLTLPASNSLAGMINYNNSTSSIPNVTPGLSFNVSALFLQPNSNDLDYAVLTNPFPIATPNWAMQEIKPDYDWGFDVGLRYVFSDPLYDVAVNWTHLNTDDSDSVHADPNQFIAPPYEVGPVGGSIREANADANFNLDSVNLTLGLYKDWGNHVQMRLFGGLNASYIKQDITTTFQDDAPTFGVTQENSSKFTGIGPRIGVNTTYYFPHGFGIVGEVAGSALIGNQQTQTNFTSFSPQLAELGITTNYQQIADEDTTQVIPELDGKIGINYTHPFHQTGQITLEIGYQAAIYVNALKQVNPTLVVDAIQLGTVAVATMGESESDFNTHGGYLKLSVKL